MLVEFWADYTCPLCYIGETCMKKAMRELGLDPDHDMIMHSFELNPYLTSSEAPDSSLKELEDKYDLSQEEAEKTAEEFEKRAEEEGLVMHYSSMIKAPTLNAHRLTKYVVQKLGAAAGHEMIEDIYRAVFSDNADISDREVLMRIGKNAGLSESEVSGLLDSEEMADIVRMEEYQAHLMGIRMVPYFSIDFSYTIEGAVSYGEMLYILRRIQKGDIPDEIGPGPVCEGERCF